MEKEKVSIIIPAYNVEKYLKKCVESLLSQTYENLEILIVDDGSKDKTLEVANELSLKDERIKVLTKENGGVSSARNLGLDNATGKYIVFVDGDDFISNQYVEVMLKTLVENDLDIVSCDFVRVKEGQEYSFKKCGKVKCKEYEAEEYFKEMFSGNTLCLALVALKIYRADLLKNFRFDTSLSQGEDISYNYVVLKKAKKVGFIKNQLYAYLIRMGSAVHSKFSTRRFCLMYKLNEFAVEMKKEKPALEKYVRTWLYFSCLESFYFMLRDKVVDKDSYKFLKEHLDENKKYLRANKKVKCFRRIFAPFGAWLINLFIKKENKR